MHILSLNKAEIDSAFGWKIPHLLNRSEVLGFASYELDCDQSFFCSKTRKESERDCMRDIRAGVEFFARLSTPALLTARGFAYHVHTLMDRTLMLF